VDSRCLGWDSNRALPEYMLQRKFRIMMWCLGAFAKLRKATVSVVMSVRPSAWNSSAPTGRILMKLDISPFFENLLRKFKFHSNPTRVTGTLHEDILTFMIISRWIILRMRIVSDKSCREHQNSHFIFHNFFRKSCRLLDNVEKCGGAREAADNNTAARCLLD
jgi:hypothetical protein